VTGGEGWCPMSWMMVVDGKECDVLLTLSKLSVGVCRR
jgi:hypothetical protein